MNIPVTAVLANLLAMLFLSLSARVIQLRRTNRVSLGHGDFPDLERAIRGQANFSEYAPFFVILTLIAELQGIHTLLLAVVALMFFVGRLLHGYYFAFAGGHMALRVLGMQLTLGMLAIMAALDLAGLFL